MDPKPKGCFWICIESAGEGQVFDIDVDIDLETTVSLFADDTSTWRADGKVRGSQRKLMQKEVDKIIAYKIAAIFFLNIAEIFMNIAAIFMNIAAILSDIASTLFLFLWSDLAKKRRVAHRENAIFALASDIHEYHAISRRFFSKYITRNIAQYRRDFQEYRRDIHDFARYSNFWRLCGGELHNLLTNIS